MDCGSSAAPAATAVYLTELSSLCPCRCISHSAPALFNSRPAGAILVIISGRAPGFSYTRAASIPTGDRGEPRKRGNKPLKQQRAVPETMPGTTLCLRLPTHVPLSFRVLPVALFFDLRAEGPRLPAPFKSDLDNYPLQRARQSIALIEDTRGEGTSL